MLGQPAKSSDTQDAVHVATIKISARRYDGTTLSPGQDVMVSGDVEFPEVEIAENGQGNAIIDPFIEQTTLDEAKYVWAVMKPGTVSNLRHAWDHKDLYVDECKGC